MNRKEEITVTFRANLKVKKQNNNDLDRIE